MVVLVLLCLLAAVGLGGAFYAYRMAFYSPQEGRDELKPIKSTQYDPYRPEMRRIYRQLKERHCEFVTIKSHDGLTLSARYYHVQDGAPLDICFHGYRSHALTDFSGGTELSFRLGHNVLLVDQRAHGKSEGRTIAFGLQERQDLLRWVDYALDRFGTDVKILLFGVSMGGATVLMASELDLPENVKGIIADCPYVSALEIILHVGTHNPLPTWLIRPFVILGAKIFGGFDLTETDARKAVAHTEVPILIIHGEDDRFVPHQMSDIVSCNPEKITRVTIPGAAHGISYLVDTARYRSEVECFLNKVL